MYVRHLGLCCILSRRVLIYKTDVALQLTKLLLKKLLLLNVNVMLSNMTVLMIFAVFYPLPLAQNF